MSSSDGGAGCVIRCDPEASRANHFLTEDDHLTLRENFGHDSDLLALLRTQVAANRAVAREIILRGIQDERQIDELEQRVNLIWASEFEKTRDGDGTIVREPGRGRLYLGTRDIVDKDVWLRDNLHKDEPGPILRIEAVLNCAGAELTSSQLQQSRHVQKPAQLDPSLYLELSLEDAALPGGHSTDNSRNVSQISVYFDSATDFIATHLGEGRNVFVHCCGGISRSASMVLAFLIQKKRLTLRDAFRFLKLQRPQIGPNGGFMEQLALLESKELGQLTLATPSCREHGLTHDQRDFTFVAPGMPTAAVAAALGI